MSEQVLLVLSLLSYSLAAGIAFIGGIRKSDDYRLPLVVLAGAVSVHTVMIAVRWKAMGHGPYVDLYEILNSNIWSTHVAVLLACGLWPLIRPALTVLLPLLQVLVLWLWVVPVQDTIAPVTYQTVWLAIHVWVGKIFFGMLLIATGLAILGMVRRRWSGFGGSTPSSVDLDVWAFQLAALAFIFETAMLVVGAIWAQDAWGRYWAWDPLESWSFATWIMLGALLHLRASGRISPQLSALAIAGVFVLAFGTFFGVPFLSTAPHKGAI